MYKNKLFIKINIDHFLSVQKLKYLSSVLLGNYFAFLKVDGGSYEICKWIEFPNQGYSQASLFSSSRQDIYMTMAKLQAAV